MSESWHVVGTYFRAIAPVTPYDPIPAGWSMAATINSLAHFEAILEIVVAEIDHYALLHGEPLVKDRLPYA